MNASVYKVCLVFSVVAFSMSTVALAGNGSMKCKKGFELMSCSEVENSVREGICWNSAKNGELSDEVKNTRCLKKKSKKMMKMKGKKPAKKAAPVEG